MANIKTEKGSGGKRGHAGKDNWLTHREEKQAGCTQRRLDGSNLGRKALTENEMERPSSRMPK